MFKTLDIKKECYTCCYYVTKKCPHIENCDMYSPDEMELPIWVLINTKGKYIGQSYFRTKFLHRAMICDYISAYERGMAEYEECGAHDVCASGIIKITDLENLSKNDERYVREYLNKLKNELHDRKIMWSYQK